MAAPKVRNSKSEPGIADLRSRLRTTLHYQIDYALDVECYLEVISISESLISDSLESFLQGKGEQVHVNTLKTLISRTRKHCVLSPNIELLNRVEYWSLDRNVCLHEFAKVHTGNQLDLEERLEFNKKTALLGKELVREVKNFVRRKKI